MAARNGRDYIQAQLASILPQLANTDECVIVDDASTDDTIRLIEEFHDKRICILRNEQRRGVIQSFGRSLQAASGDIIFLSDQDDIWRNDKVERFLNLFETRPDVVVALSDFVVIDKTGNVIPPPKRTPRSFRGGLLSVLLQNRYQGSAMALRRCVLQHCLPFPEDIPMHDMWIGIIGQFLGHVEFIHESLLYYRRHGSNQSPSQHAPIMRMIRWRIALLKNVILWTLRARKRS